MDGINKRKFFRVWRARIKMSRLLINNFAMQGVCKNISAGGILFESFQPLQQGALVEFTITLPGFGKSAVPPLPSDDISGQAKVVRSIKRPTGPEYDIALEFMDLSANTRQQLDHFIRSHKA